MWIDNHMKNKNKKCYNCDEYGHISADCRVIKAESYQQCVFCLSNHNKSDC